MFGEGQIILAEASDLRDDLSMTSIDVHILGDT